ncbi:hypothetical protein MMC25_001814 [Agyrium rufum]|nr:hypothetical protein [Agyrium rufum]
MDQPGQLGIPGTTNRRLHIAHRRNPSDMTPMLMEQFALQQQIELLQQQQQQIAATHQQFVQMGMISQGQQLPTLNYPNGQGQVSMGGMPSQINAFQFPQQLQQQQQQQQQLAASMAPPSQQNTHRRNQSAMPNMGIGPPPAPSSGTSGFNDYNQQSNNNNNSNHNNNHPSRENGGQRGGRGGGAAGAGHARRHSLALPEAKKAAELAQQKRATSGFQFPIPGAGGASPSSTNRSASPADSDDKGSQGQQTQPAQTGLNVRAGNRGGSLGHGRSQSMAVGNSRGGSNAGGRGGASFQFPPPMATNDAGASAGNQADFQRRGSNNSNGNGHARGASRNFDGNWRQQSGSQEQQPQQQPSLSVPQNPNAPVFQPGHRARGSMNQSFGSTGSFQFPNQPQLVQLPQGQVMLQQPQMPQMFPGQQLTPAQINQLQALQIAQMNGQQFGLNASQHAQPQLSAQQQQQQQRKTLFTPYLPQATLPALLSDGQLVSGILRVNKKNRSDAYVTCTDLDADIFICGSKDRNRALEGDLVAIELLDVDEVWGQKREKEEKKKRKDITDTRGGTSNSNDRAKSDTTSDTSTTVAADGGIRRRGSLRQRPTQKKNDDVEVEGQSLLLMEEEEINDEQKPLYAGHVVAVVERMAGQTFSGTLGLLRPSSQATKEKQEAERQHRDGSSGRHQQDRHQDKPKIVWFKPTDKRVPLIAIPTEQAPRDFVEKHQDYANKIFVACIKRWPITSLHPFGTLNEQLGDMGDLKVETDALLRDNNFGPDDFSDAVLKNVGFDEWSIENENEDAIKARRDFRDETTFTIDPNGSQDLDDALHVKELGNGKIEIGIHVADAAHFIKANSLVDREARKRGTGVFLMNRAVNMLPSKLSNDVCSLSPGQARLTVSVVFQVERASGKILDNETWIGKSIINSSGKLSYDEVDAVINGDADPKLQGAKKQDIEILREVVQRFRQARYGSDAENIPSLRLLYQLDDENVPVEHNIFDSSPAHELIEELSFKANSFVAQKIASSLPEKAFLRTHAPPKAARMQTFAERMTRLGYEIDTTTSGSLQRSLFKIKDEDLRKGMETLLLKTLTRAKYVVAGRTRQNTFSHFALNLPLYTHFTSPFRRYADLVVHRQLDVALSNGKLEFTEETDNLVKIAEQCNTKKDSAQAAQEQSVHIESCRMMDKKRLAQGGELISEGIVICVYESAFDVVIPEYGFEKRVHCDQLPLKKAEFRKETRVLELYWEKGVNASTYTPEDERPNNRNGSLSDGRPSRSNTSASATTSREGGNATKGGKSMDTGSISTDAIDALFDDDDDDGMSEITEAAAGVSLGPSSSHEHNSNGTTNNSSSTKGNLSGKEKLAKYFEGSLREEGGEYIQDVKEMTKLPVILKTDLSKSPPCLSIRSLNPFAL